MIAPAHRPLLLAVIVLVNALILGSPASAADEIDAREVGQQIDEVVGGYLEESGAPGAAVAVTRGTRVLHTSGVGIDAHGEPITADTRLRIASLSKSFTALAVMQLVDDGRLELDDPVVDHLPAFTLDDARVGDITVRQLLNHSSGMADAASPDEYTSGPDDLAGAVRRLRSASLVAEPGTEWNYHNPNYHVAARLVEVVSGQDFASYLDDQVFGPAGMTSSTSTATTNAPVAGLADGHTFAFGQAVPVDGPDYFTAGAGGVVSTAEDMARWLVLQNSGGRSASGRQVVSPGAMEAMHTAQEPNDGTYALGWYHTPQDEDRAEHISHSGGAAAFSGYQVLYPTPGDDYGIVVLLDSGASLTGPTPTDPAQQIAALLGVDSPPAQDPSRAVVVDVTTTAAGLLILALGWRGFRRAPLWALRRRGRSRWWSAVRLAPYLLVVAFVLAVPRVQLLLLQRDAPWQVLFYVAPLLVVVLALLAVACAVVPVARLVHLARGPGAREHTTLPNPPTTPSP